MFNCRCIHLSFNFVSRKFNNVSSVCHEKKIRKVRTVRIIFLALASFAVPARNLSCQSWTRWITRQIRDACHNVVTVKIERFCGTRWMKRMQIHPARRRGREKKNEKIKLKRGSRGKMRGKSQMREEDELVPLAIFLTSSKTGTQRARIQSSSRNGIGRPSEKLAERSVSFTTRVADDTNWIARDATSSKTQLQAAIAWLRRVLPRSCCRWRKLSYVSRGTNSAWYSTWNEYDDVRDGIAMRIAQNDRVCKFVDSARTL